jgi:anti-sigma regulatory factor (Ser/Thr protein kinase)
MIPARIIRAASGAAASGPAPCGAGPSGTAPWGAGPWPERSGLELGAFASAVPCARIHARLVVAEWGLRDLADTVELVVSELVTNAVQAAGPSRDIGQFIPVIRLCLASDGHSVLIRVWDGSSQAPVRREAGPDDESGRGLLIVEASGRDWGSYRTPDGKVVWVLI